MSKMQMAHEYVMNYLGNPACENTTVSNVISVAWAYADAMQAEAEKRLTEVRIDGVSEEHADALRKACGEEWQPDWSQAPDWAKYWVMDYNGICYWTESQPIRKWNKYAIIKNEKETDLDENLQI